MYKFLLLVIALVSVVTLLSLPVTASRIQHIKASSHRVSIEPKLSSIPSDWSEGSVDAPHDLPIELVLFIKQQNLDTLERLLVEVSTPMSPSYGRHYSLEEVNKLVSPSEQAITTILGWLSESGVDIKTVDHSPAMDIIRVKLPVAAAEKLLNADFRQYVNEETHEVIVRTNAYTVPSHVAPFLDFVGPALRFPRDTAPVVRSVATRNMIKTKRQRRASHKNKRKNLHSKPSRKQRLPVHRFFTEHPEELIRYSPDECVQQDVCPPRTGFAKGLGLDDDYVFYDLASIQPSLDAATYWSSKNDSQEWQLPTMTTALLRGMYGLEGVTAQHPNSSVAVTGFLDQFISLSDLRAFMDLYEPQLVKRGVSIYGPNDQGVPGGEGNLDIQYAAALSPGVESTVYWSTAGRQEDNIENEPFLEFLFNVSSTVKVPHVFSISYGDDEATVSPSYASRVDVEFKKAGLRGITMLVSSGDGGAAGSRPIDCSAYIPTFPAASPWVTAVGGTTSMEPEVAAGLSAGGFSNRYPIPAWQRDAVDTYKLKAQAGGTLPPFSMFNNTGAGFPDIAASALRFPIVISGEVEVVDGTSCSAPVVAAIVSLLNDHRLKAGKSPLGFLNPLLYSNPDMFNDIVDGSNPACGESGYTATPGWDPVTGLGTPNFAKMLDVVMSLP